MEASDALVLGGAVLSALAVAALRASWGRPIRSHRLNAVAWSLLLSGLLLGVSGHGAWGLAIAVLAGMAMASLVLCHSAVLSGPGKAKAANRRAHMLPERGEPRHVSRRIGTFLLTVPASLVAAVLIAMGLRALSSQLGWSDVNANVLALLTMPIVWSAMMVQLLMARDAMSRTLGLVAPAGLGAFLILVGAIG